MLFLILFYSTICYGVKLHKTTYGCLVQGTELIIEGKILDRSYKFITTEEGRPLGKIMSVEVKRVIFGEEKDKIVYIIKGHANPDTYNEYIFQNGKELIFFLNDPKDDKMVEEALKFKDLPKMKYYSIGCIRFGVYDLSIKENQEFAKNVGEVIKAVRIKDVSERIEKLSKLLDYPDKYNVDYIIQYIADLRCPTIQYITDLDFPVKDLADLKVEKLSKLLDYPDKYNIDNIIRYIATVRSPKGVPVLKKYILSNFKDEKKKYTIDNIIQNMGRIEEKEGIKEVIDIAFELIENNEIRDLGKRILYSIPEHNRMNKYIYERFKKNNVDYMKKIAFEYISREEEIHNLEIEYLKEILLDINETTENRLLAAELISKVKDKDLLNRTIEILELVRYDKDENIAKKAVEYIKSLKEVNELK
jgi:hypothetical protein